MQLVNYSKIVISLPAKVCNFTKKIFWKDQNKGKEAGIVHFQCLECIKNFWLST